MPKHLPPKKKHIFFVQIKYLGCSRKRGQNRKKKETTQPKKTTVLWTPLWTGFRVGIKRIRCKTAPGAGCGSTSLKRGSTRWQRANPKLQTLHPGNLTWSTSNNDGSFIRYLLSNYGQLWVSISFYSFFWGGCRNRNNEITRILDPQIPKHQPTSKKHGRKT